MYTESHFNAMKNLQEFIRPKINWSFPLQTRVHPLNGIKRLNTGVYIKREDETGFGISGSKYRKYASLIPFLIQNNFQKVIIIGGAYSNNVLGLCQLCNEFLIPYKLFLRGEPDVNKSIGNKLLIELLTEKKNITWITRSDWNKVLEFANETAEKERSYGTKTFVIPEGSAVIPAFYGTSTLALDIIRNEQVSGLYFDSIIMDAGTGMTAAVTLACLRYIGVEKKFFIILTAGNSISFKIQYETWTDFLITHLGNGVLSPDFSYSQIEFLEPELSFGRNNAGTFQMIRNIALSEGILIDPVYGAKFFQGAKIIIEDFRLSGNVLLINSGGGIGMTGFQQEIFNSL